MKSMIKINVWEKLALRLFASWCLATIIISIQIREVMYSVWAISQMEMVDLFSKILVFYAVITILDMLICKYCKNVNLDIDIIIYSVSVVLFGVNAVFMVRDQYLALMVIVGVGFCLSLVIKKCGLLLVKKDVSKRTMIIIVVLVALCTLLLMGTMTVLRYKAFKTSTFDFGIFCQMFYNMKESFLPMTTCERGVWLSHFAVHVSPIYYLILPIYCIFPYNETLIIVQLLFIISGVIPLLLICKHRKMSNTVTMLLSAAYLVSPVLFGGLFYDFHENKFLTTLILWLMYFVEKEKKIGIYIFAILVLMVKEDAGIYVACIGLYMIATKLKKEKIHGLIIFIISVVWFLLAYNWLNSGGDGAMTGRYQNFMSEKDGSVFEILSTIIKNPAYFFKQLLKVEKLIELLWVIVPLALMPFRVKSIKELILLIPFLVINLMPSYVYQYNIAHQYFYGSFALMLYLVIVNMNAKRKLQSISTAVYIALASLIMYTSYVTVNIDDIGEYFNNREDYQLIAEALEEIPEEASVSVTTYMMPNVSMRKEVYRYPEGSGCDYVVFDMTRMSYVSQYNADIQELLSDGYVIDNEVKNKLIILKSVSQ